MLVKAESGKMYFCSNVEVIRAKKDIFFEFACFERGMNIMLVLYDVCKGRSELFSPPSNLHGQAKKRPTASSDKLLQMKE